MHAKHEPHFLLAVTGCSPDLSDIKKGGRSKEKKQQPLPWQIDTEKDAKGKGKGDSGYKEMDPQFPPKLDLVLQRKIVLFDKSSRRTVWPCGSGNAKKLWWLC